MKNLFLILALFIFAGISFAQKNTDEATIVSADANSCELNSLYIDLLRNELSKNNEKVFVFVRKTKGETNYVRQQRLSQIRSILLGYKGYAKEKVIFAEGEDDETQGKVEFYLGSRLFFVALAKNNLRICWDCCDVGYEFYVKVPKPKRISKKKQK
ncbi:MAG: hypothetical protein M3367_06435 [Acidobacteriota bacterium]|nr:hypothetical protein [Acidobacteriota bacterium]